MTGAAEWACELPGVYSTFDPRAAGVAAAYAGVRMYGVRVIIPRPGTLSCIAFCLASSGTGEHFDLGVLDTNSGTRTLLYSVGGGAGAALPAGVSSPTWVGAGSGLQFPAPSLAVNTLDQVDLFLGLDNTTATVVRAVVGATPPLPTGLMAAPGGGSPVIGWVYTAGYFCPSAGIADSTLAGFAAVSPLIVVGIT